MAEVRPPASGYHAPVLLDEVVELLGNAKSVLDGTLGGGGHSEALLMKGVRVVGTDRDPEAVAAASARLASYQNTGQFTAVLSTYDAVDEVGALARSSTAYSSISAFRRASSMRNRVVSPSAKARHSTCGWVAMVRQPRTS